VLIFQKMMTYFYIYLYLLDKQWSVKEEYIYIIAAQPMCP